jgi:hypothetical protein
VNIEILGVLEINFSMELHVNNNLFRLLSILCFVCVFQVNNAYGVGPYYIDDGNVTVIDKGTWLEWQKDGSSNFMIWTDALLYCEDLYLDGHDDWRLPNVRELHSIVDVNRSDPSIDAVFFSNPDGYWTSTTNKETTDKAWTVLFSDGSNYPWPKYSTYARYVAYTRCVREGFSDPGPFNFNLIFLGNGNGTVYLGDPDSGSDPIILRSNYYSVYGKYYNIDLYAFASPGSGFKGFSGELCPNGSSCHFKMTTDATVFVNFNDPNKKNNVPVYFLLRKP